MMNKITAVFWRGSGSKALGSVLGICLVAFLNIQEVSAQVSLPHYDGMDYTAGQTLPEQTAGGWVINQTATGDLSILEGSLSYSGLQVSTGNKVGFAGGGEDAIKQFTQTTSGIVYYSYIFSITDMGSSFAGLLPNSVATSTSAPGSGSIGACVWVKPSGNAGFFNIGLSARANQTTIGTEPNNLQYGSEEYAYNTPIFVVLSYEMVDGSANDIVNLWINPVPGAAAPAVSFTTTPSSDIADMSGFFIKQNGNSNTPNVEMDEIRIGTSWADVTPSGVVVVVTPTLIADDTNTTVDYDLDITFTDDAAWRAAVTAVKINGTAITAGTDYELTAGNLKLKPSGLNALLTVSGSKTVTVEATGYDDATIVQPIGAGMPTSNSIASIIAPLLTGATSTITLTAKDQYNNFVEGYSFKFDISVTNNDATIAETYTAGAMPFTSSTNDTSVPMSTNASGVATFTVVMPGAIDGNDGVSVQMQLADGATNIGPAFSFIQLSPQTISFGALSAVTYGDAAFNLTATASSGLPVSYSSSNTAVATVDASGVVTIIGAGSTTITAMQGGDASYNAAPQVSQVLTVNCAASSASLSGTTTICAGNTANLQVSVTAMLAQQYTVVYSDGTTNYTVSNYSSGDLISVSPSAGTTYTLVSVQGSNPNICEASVSGSAVLTVNATPAPTGDALQTFTTNSPVYISDLVVSGTNVVWYASEGNALAGTGALNSELQLISGNTYYAMQTINGCASQSPLAVMVTIVLNAQTFDQSAYSVYPNPVKDVLYLTARSPISNVTILNALGQELYSTQPNTTETAVQVSFLASGTYFVAITVSGSTSIERIIK